MPEINDIETRLRNLEGLFSRHLGSQETMMRAALPHPNMHINQQYVIAAYSPDRALNPSITTLTETATVLGTLIEDLRMLGLIG